LLLSAVRCSFQTPVPHLFNMSVVDPGIKWAADYVLERTRLPVELEQRVDVTDKAGQLLTFGYLDAAWRDKDGGLHLADLKTGSVREYKPQLSVYALGLMQRDGDESVTCHELYSEISWANRYVVTRGEAERLINKVVGTRKNPTKSPVPCEYCSWCKHQVTCLALNSAAMTVAERNTEVVEKYHPAAVASPLMIGRMLTVANALEGWVKAVKAKSKEFDDVPGYRKVQRKGRPALNDLVSAFKKLDLTHEEFLSACSISLDKLAKTVARKEGKDEKAARANIEKSLRTLIKTGKKIEYWSK